MMSATDRRRDLVAELGGTLWLAATLFTATVCLGLSLVWLVEGRREPGTSMIVLAVAAIVATVVSSFADNSWSARQLKTVELGNATRLFAITSILFLIPTVLISVTAGEEQLPARDLDAACPPGSVPDVGFADVLVDSSDASTASCLSWWGVLSSDGGALALRQPVVRAQVATLVDNVVRSAGAPLGEAPDAVLPADAAETVHAPAIARILTTDLMGGLAADRFGAADPVTRSQLATVLSRTHEHVTGAALAPAAEEHFDDLEDSVHADAIERVAAAGIAVGDGERFGPDEPATRGEVFSGLARSLDLWVAEHGVPVPVAPPG